MRVPVRRVDETGWRFMGDLDSGYWYGNNYGIFVDSIDRLF